MKENIKKTAIYTTLIALLVALLILCISMGTGGLVAEAATTPRYAVSFDYTCYYQYNTSKTVRQRSQTQRAVRPQFLLQCMVVRHREAVLLQMAEL